MAATPVPSRGPRPALILGVFFLSLYLLTMGGHLDSPDEELMFQVTRSLVEHGSMQIADTVISRNLVLSGVDGRNYVPYGPVSSILSLPFFKVGQAMAAVLPPRYSEVVLRFAVGMRDPLISAAACVLFYALALELRFGTKVGALLTLGFGATTFVWPFARYSFSEPVTGFCVLLAVFAAIRTVRSGHLAWSALSAIALGLAIGSKVTTAVALPAVLIYLAGAGEGAARQRARRLLPFLLVFMVPAVSLGLLNIAKWGTPLETGYHLDGLFAIWPPIGIAGLLLSPDKSLFLYAPVALLGLAGLARLAARWPWETGLFIWLLASHIVVYGLLVIWHGDGGWGPRYLEPVVPFIVLPAGALLAWPRGQARRLPWASFGVLCGLGVIVNLGGVLVDQRVSFDILFAAAGGNLADNAPRWNPALSPVLIHWQEIGRRYANLVKLWSQPVSVVSGTYGKEAIEPVDEPSAPSSDLFPRWTSGSAVFEVKNRHQPVELMLEYLDNRPSPLGPAVVQILVNGSPLPEGNITRTRSEVPLPDKRLPWFVQARLDDAVMANDAVTVEIRTETWHAPPDIRDLGIQIWDLGFHSNGQALAMGEAVFSPMPVTDERSWSYELEIWFYTPPSHIADVWLWYLYLSGLPRSFLLLGLLPALGVLWSGLQLWRFVGGSGSGGRPALQGKG